MFSSSEAERERRRSVRPSGNLEPAKGGRRARTLVLCVVWISHCTANAEDVPIFSEASTSPTANEEPALRVRAVDVNFDRLRDVVEARGAQDENVPKMPLQLNLFDDVAFEGLVQHAEPTMSGHVLSGVLKDVSPSSMTIVVNDGIIVGEVHTPAAAYIIRTAADGRHFVREVALASRDLDVAGCGTDLRDLREDWEPHPVDGALDLDDEHLGDDTLSLPSTSDLEPEASRDTLAGSGLSGSADREEPAYAGTSGAIASACMSGGEELPGVVDVLVAYTGAAKSDAGGSSQIRASIDLGVGITNAALRNSGGVGVTIRLVGTTEMAYSETGDAETDLDRLRGRTDGYMDSIHGIRDACVADLVHLIVAESNVGGRARLEFGLTAHGSLGNGTMAHEIGHNFGLWHDRYQIYANNSREASSSYQHGYVNTRGLQANAPASSRWRTVMSYQDRCRNAGVSCVRIRYYSNPNETYNGDPMGVGGDHWTRSVDGPANAARTLGENASREMNRRLGPTRVLQAMGRSLTMDMLLQAGE